MLLNNSIKKETIEGVYRIKHPIETYNIARNKLLEFFPELNIKYIIDDNDFGLSALHPRAVILKEDDEVNDALAWGKGVTPIASACSALMEFIEVESKIDKIRNYLGIEGDEKYIYNKVYKPIEQGSISEIKEISKKFNNMNDIFVPVSKLGTNHTSEFSLEFIILLLAGRYEISNSLDLDSDYIGSGSYGAGSGNSYEEAIVHSLIELTELLVEGTVLRKNKQLNEIDKETIDNKLIRELLKEFNECGLDVKLSDWSCGLEIPAIGLTYWSEESKKHYYKIGTGTTREEAAQRAITEFIQTLGPQKFSEKYSVGFLSQLRDSDNIMFSENKISFKDVRNIDDMDIKSEVETISNIFKSIGINIYVWDLTHSRLNMPVVQLFLLNDDYDGKITLENSNITLI